MAGSNNFLVWNPTKSNQEDDAAYAADAQRLAGAAVDAIWASALANKTLYQVTTFISALGAALAAKGYNVSDADLSTLQAVLSNIITQADTPLPIANGGTGASSFAAAGLVTISELENSPNTVNGSTSDPTTTSTSPVLLTDLTYSGSFSGRKVSINFSCEVSNTGPSETTFFRIYKDGSPVGPEYTVSSPIASQNETSQGAWFDLPSAGSHTYEIRWYVTGGTSTAANTNRTLQVTEI